MKIRVLLEYEFKPDVDITPGEPTWGIMDYYWKRFEQDRFLFETISPVWNSPTRIDIQGIDS